MSKMNVFEKNVFRTRLKCFASYDKSWYVSVFQSSGTCKGRNLHTHPIFS